MLANDARLAGLTQPTVFQGLVSDWPAVRHARSAEGIAPYLRSLDNGAQLDALRMPPSARGRIFYTEGLEGFNYTREKVTLSALLDRLEKYAKLESPASLVVQSALVSECLPGFLAQHAMPLLDASVAPRIWIGNHVVTPAHFDESHNVACVVAGQRRFTLFAPEQIANLYVGPVGYAPTGTPISLVDFARPDLPRFPRFAEARAAARVFELEPGDALFIPALWWHHVESLSKVNALVNYWWKPVAGPGGRNDSALDALLLTLHHLRHLPPEQRKAWGAIFDHWVFGADADTARHIPAARRGVLGEITPELARDIRAFLRGKIKD
jgi:hypothetical protein